MFEQIQALLRRATGGAFALAASRIIIQACGLIILIVAAKILDQAEVGFFALMSSVVMIGQRISEAGWTELVTLSRTKSEPDPEIFWSALLSSVAVSLLLLSGAFMATMLFGDKWMDWSIFLVLVASIIPSAISSCQHGLLIRDGRLGVLGLIQGFAEVAGAAVAVAMLIGGHRLIALAISRLIIAIVTTVLASAAAQWFPRPSIRMDELRSALHYSFQQVIAKIVGFVSAYGSEFIIGIFLGLKDVGIYRVASRIAGAVAEVCFEPLRVIGWNVIANAGHSSNPASALPHAIRSVCVVGVYFALPIFTLLAILSSDIIGVILGRADWMAAAPIIAILAASKILSIIQVVGQSSLSAAKVPQWIPRLAIFGAATSVGFTVILGVIYSNVGSVAVSQLIAVLCSSIALAYLLKKHAGFSMIDIRSALVKAGSGVALLAVSTLAFKYFITGIAGINAIGQIAFLLFIGVAAYYIVVKDRPIVALRLAMKKEINV